MAVQFSCGLGYGAAADEDIRAPGRRVGHAAYNIDTMGAKGALKCGVLVLEYDLAR